MRKRDICFLQYSLGGGGAERKVCTLANFFVKQGYHVDIGLFGKNTVAYSLDSRVQVTFIPDEPQAYNGLVDQFATLFRQFAVKPFLLTLAYVIEKVCRILQVKVPHSMSRERIEKHFNQLFHYRLALKRYVKNRPDAILITMISQTFVMVMDVLSRDFQNKRIRNPYIVMECNNPKPGMDATEELDRKRNQYYTMASKCVVMTKGIMDYFGQEIQRKCVVIPNPLRDDLPEVWAGPRRNTIVNYGRMSLQKNIPLLIDAFAEIHKLFPAYQLELYGEGELKESIQAYIDSKQLSASCSLMPFDKNIHSKIRDCLMFVSTSNWEGFPNAVMEALAIGLPVISTDCEFGPADLIDTGTNGLLVPAEDKDALVKAMQIIIENEDLRERFSSHAQMTREKYDVEKIGAQWIDLIDGIE